MAIRYDPVAVSAAFQRLFRTFPAFGAGENAREFLAVYFDAVSIYETQDIEAGCRAFLDGTAKDYNPAFAPSAPQVGAEVRRALNKRVEREEIQRKAEQALLPPPEREKIDPEMAAKTKQLVDETVARLKSITAEQTRALDPREAARRELAHQEWLKDIREQTPIEERLNLQQDRSMDRAG